MEEVKIKDINEKDEIAKNVLFNFNIMNQMAMLEAMKKELQCTCKNHVAVNFENSDFDHIEFRRCLICGKYLRKNDYAIADFKVKLNKSNIEDEYFKQVETFKEILTCENSLELAIEAYSNKLNEYSKLVKKIDF